jgi:hypothetical protein
MQIDLFGNVIVEETEEEVKVTKPSPFEYTAAIADKNYPESLEYYDPWLTNLSFSQRNDTIFFANEINKYHQLGNKEQFDFYYYGLPKKKYFAKWAKKMKSDNTHMIMDYFNVSFKVAKQYEQILRPQELDKIKNWFENKKGGK